MTNPHIDAVVQVPLFSEEDCRVLCKRAAALPWQPAQMLSSQR